jgi:hypothetical protein
MQVLKPYLLHPLLLTFLTPEGVTTK